jgi:hypothetical protein
MNTNDYNVPAQSTSSLIGVFMRMSLWLGDNPSQKELDEDFFGRMTRCVFSRTLRCGVRVRARTDGLFELDLTALPGCEDVLVPPLASSSTPEERSAHFKADDRASASLSERLTYVNVFKACLDTAMTHVQKHSIPLDAPDLPTQYVALFAPDTFDRNQYLDRDLKRRLEEHYTDVRTSMAEGLSGGTLVTAEALEYLTELFQRIIDRGRAFAQVIDLLYHQHHLHSNHRFSESLVGAWAIVEQAIFVLWKNYLADCAAAGTAMPKGRKKKLAGRDFTASVVQETLNLAGVLPDDLYGEIDTTRKARNSWIHALQVASPTQSSQALSLCQKMLLRAFGVDIRLSTGYAVTKMMRNISIRQNSPV